MTRKIFFSSALPYANGPFHIGHIMEYIQADIWVRFQRMLGNEVHFVCADDAHGAPIMLKAQAEGITPQELVARIAAGRPQYLQGFHISYDHWHSTDSPENVELSQDIYARLKKAGLIYVKPVEQFYDPVKGMFLPDRYIKGECPNCHSKDQYGDACEVCSTVYSPTELINPYSTLSGTKPVLKTSDHYFFQLSNPRCVEFVRSWLETRGRRAKRAASRNFSRHPTPSRFISSARTSSTSTPCSGPRCCSSRGHPTKCRTTCTSTGALRFPARRCRSRAGQESVHCATSRSV